MSMVRVNDDIKKEVTPILEKLGLSLGDAVNIYLHQIKLTGGIPFELKIPEYSDEMKKALKEADEIEKNPSKYPSYNSANELIKELDKDE